MAEKIEVFGVRIDNVTLAETLDLAEAFVAEGSPHLVCTPNVEHVMVALEDREFCEILNTADATLPDGAGVVLVSRWNGTPLKEKVAGSDLLPLLCERAADKGYRVFLFGGKPGVPERAAERLRSQYPSLKVVGCHSPPMNFEEDQAENERAIKAVTEANPDILFVALGAPRQEKWIHRNKERLGAPLMMGVGAAIDFAAGEKKRSPRWMSDYGLEWFYRFMQEPKRLWRRYLVSFPVLASMFFDLRTYSAQKRTIDIGIVSGKLLFMGLAIFLTYCFSVWIRHINAPHPFLPPWDGFFGAYQSLLPFVILSFLFAFVHFGLLSGRPLSGPKEMLWRSYQASSLGTVCVLVCSFVFKDIYTSQITGYSRTSIAVTWLLNGGLFFAWKIIGWRVGQALARRGLWIDRLLILGASDLAAQLIRNLDSQEIRAIRAAAILDDKLAIGSAFEGVPVCGRLDEFRNIIRARKVDDVVIASELSERIQLDTILRECGRLGIRVSVLSGLPSDLLRGGMVATIAGMSTIMLNVRFR